MFNFSFNPLLTRRLVWLLGCMAFGFALGLHGLASLAAFGLSFIGLVAEQYLAKVYGPAAEPLIPRLPKLPHLPRLDELSKGTRVLLLGVVALLTFALLPPTMRALGFRFGGFDLDTINAYTLGAAQYFLALTMAYVSWRGLFPGLYEYAAETMEGKLLESITSGLLDRLPTEFFSGLEHEITLRLAVLAERRHIVTLQFIQRCVRFVLSVAPFVVFFLLSNAALTGALTAVPAAVPGL